MGLRLSPNTLYYVETYESGCMPEYFAIDRDFYKRETVGVRCKREYPHSCVTYEGDIRYDTTKYKETKYDLYVYSPSQAPAWANNF
jgi:hypothetical protein